VTEDLAEEARALLHLAECATSKGLESSRERSREAYRAGEVVMMRLARCEEPSVLEATRWLIACEAEEPGDGHAGPWDCLRRAIAGRRGKE